MKTKKLLVIGATIAILGTAGCTNPIGRMQDEFQHGSRKAHPHYYFGLGGIKDFKKRVDVYENFVELKSGFMKDKNFVKYIYKDVDNDGDVDIYTYSRYYGISFNNHPPGWRNNITVYSKEFWNKHMLPRLPNVNRFHFYADKELQKVIDKDYKILREKGTKKTLADQV